MLSMIHEVSRSLFRDGTWHAFLLVLSLDIALQVAIQKGR